MATKKAHQPKPAGGPTEGLRVIARSPQGIRRAGRHWGAEGETVSLADLTDDQVEMLRDDPALIVSDVTIDAAG